GNRGHAVEIPHGDTYLQENDIVTVMGTETALQDFREKFRSSLAR
ncbi:MAG: TrkA C-terminal domain-containing protein, partial [Bacteroidales bacterium]|nr:TrkA C-terminal domain-containing protein [Bacteroidales bacterium]